MVLKDLFGMTDQAGKPYNSHVVPVIQREDYTIYLERVVAPEANMTLVHSLVHTTWTPNRQRSWRRDFDLLVGLQGEPIYTICDVGNNKLRKFIRLAGFEYLSNSFHENGQEYEIYIRR